MEHNPSNTSPESHPCTINAKVLEPKPFSIGSSATTPVHDRRSDYREDIRDTEKDSRRIDLLRKRKFVDLTEEDDKDDEDAGMDAADLEVRHEVEDEVDDDILKGDEFQKAASYDKYLDEPNPWHQSLKKKLLPSQIIGFRWMLDRHGCGGGLIADKVGTGKVCQTETCANGD